MTVPADPLEFDVPTTGDDGYETDPAGVEAMLDDDTPSPEQLAIARGRGGILIGKSDRSESGGIPLGSPPDAVGGTVVKLDPLNRHGVTAEFTVDGLGDSVIREVCGRYAARIAGADPSERLAAMEAAYVEIAAIKAALRRAAPPQPQHQSHAPRPPQAAAPPAGPPPAAGAAVDVVFDFGGVDGRRLARYRDAIIHDSVLVLVAAEADRAAGIYLPPAFGASRPFLVTLPGLPDPVRVFSGGVTYPYAGALHCVLFVDRSDG